MRRIHYACLALASLALPAAALADDAAYTVTLKDHRFTPAELTVPAGQPIAVTVKNMDATAEEFESEDLDFEKIIPANSEGLVHIRPLSPGKYHFFGDYHQDTAQGDFIAK